MNYLRPKGRGLTKIITYGFDATKFMRFTEWYSYYWIDVLQNISYLYFDRWNSLVCMKITATLVSMEN